MSARVTVIAEIGENHLGQWDLARQLVIEAARAGADIVKFQSYLGSSIAEDDPEKAWFTKVAVPDEEHRRLAAVAAEHGAEFLSTPFTVERAVFLCERLGLRALKIASSELLNAPLLDYAARHAQTVFLSTGLATLEEVRQAAARLSAVPRVVILHCVTQYPTEDADANLRAIATLREAFPRHEIGYSDHTLGIVAALGAVALGATVIEKHFTLHKALPGTDHVLSATPEELTTLVQQIRRLERMLGHGRKEPAAAELAIREAVRARFPKDAA